VLSYDDGFAITHLAAHLGGGTLTATGAITPNLSLEAAAQGIRLEDIPGLMPSAGLAGILSARIALSGTIAAPLGHVALTATDLRAAATGNRIAPATVKADIQLAATQAQIDARFQAGDTVDLALTGSAPLSATAAMDMQAKGKLDLALFDPLLAPAGRRARGTLVVDAAITGTPNMPHVTGGAELTGGEIQDYARGFRLSGIAASITAQGTRLTIARLTGRAGDGTLSASGTIDLAAPDLPVAMTLSASNARPMVSDLFSATLNGTLALKGHVRTDLDLSGALDIARGQINLPENFPPEVAVLSVRHRGRPAPPSRTQPGRIRLDVAVRTSGPIFVRGRGIDAVMEGDMHLSGLVTQPQVGGSFHMVRGSYTLGGQTLNFDNGSVTFDGSSVSGRLDPALNFRAHTESGGVTANLTVTGYASAPKIALSSSPSLPQDEIVAHLLFQQSTKQLSPLQLASIAQALAAMGGVGGGFDPLATVRQTLGLDRLAVGSAAVAGQAQSQTTVEAGRYLANGIYVGVKQNLAGGTQTQVQVDITRQLKAQATLATGTSAVPSTTLHDNGSSVGLSYQFEY
jgi:translocation and assembly module TamB